MPYTTREAIATLSTYLGINLGVSVRSIDQTSNRGYEIHLPSDERCVIFVYPISHKQDDSKNFFDTRDSGARERGVAWNYAQTHNLKYFCLAVHDQVEKYKDYIFSLECDEHRIAEVSGTLNGSRNGRGTQVVIPTSCVPSKEFERIYTDNGFYIAVVHKDHIYDYLEQYDNRPYMDKTLPLVDINDVEDDNSIVPSIPSPFTPCQIIYYGVPGCGKSYEVEKDIDKELNEHGVENKEYHKVRCVFHPEYTNADFVGQVYPFVDPDGHGVDYRFKPGPFAEIVRRAYHEPDKPFFLIIEEINRGNAAAIFGEMFQLLDRIKPGDNPDTSTENIYQPGWSSYGVSNTDVNAYIRQKTTDEEEIRAKRQNKESLFETEINFQRDDCAHVVVNDGIRDERAHRLHFTWTTAIRLPPNLSIYATMNTSDQNVITMDNAFQRRFKSTMIRNNLKNAAQYNIKIEGTNVCWGAFRDWVNGKILSTPNISKADDKCLGGWFISTPVEAKDDDGNVTKFKDIKREDFAEKVIKYLWDDVFKRNAATEIFKKGSGNGEFKSLSELIDAFENETGQLSESFDKVFKLSEAEMTGLSKAYDVPQSDNPESGVHTDGEPVADA